jgi:hypothetical protein
LPSSGENISTVFPCPANLPASSELWGHNWPGEIAETKGEEESGEETDMEKASKVHCVASVFVQEA